VAVDSSQVDRPAGATPRTEDFQPRRSGDQRSPNGGRRQHVAAGGQATVPAVDDELCLQACGLVRLELGGTSLDEECPCPNACVSPAQLISGQSPCAGRQSLFAGPAIELLSDFWLRTQHVEHRPFSGMIVHQAKPEPFYVGYELPIGGDGVLEVCLFVDEDVVVGWCRTPLCQMPWVDQ
jgi:hypothetical protein